MQIRKGPGSFFHPPLIYLAALLVGIGLNHRWPLSLRPDRWGDVAGLVLIAAGVAIMPPVLRRFRRADKGRRGPSFQVAAANLRLGLPNAKARVGDPLPLPPQSDRRNTTVGTIMDP
ncbi:MAG: hypothetical protein JXB13_08585 [Phycisphaerae bacterium]|nr:hypothetical protein [Phycisphaerae bacterium]